MNKCIIIALVFFSCIIIFIICKFILIQNNYCSYKNPNERNYDKILKWFNDFSNVYNINYSLTYGTLLGYIRNKTYIPYDLDMDLFIGKKDAYKILDLINNDNIIYNSDIKSIKPDRFYIIINKSHNYKINGRKRYNCKGKLVDKQIDNCSFNGLFGRILYNNVHCDLFVYSCINKETEYSKKCRKLGCVYLATDYGINIPDTINIKMNNIDSKIFKSEKLIHNLLSSWYGDNYITPDHECNNNKWVKI